MDSMKRVILFIAVLLGGCAFLTAPETPGMILLHIEGGGAEIESMPATGAALLVGVPRAHSGYGSARFVYIQEDHQLDHYGRHGWADDPGKLIRSALVRTLEASGAFDAVLPAPSTATANLRLELELVALHQDYRAGRVSEVRLAMRAQVINLANREVLATRSFDFREEAGRGPKAGAGAADRALARLLEAMTDFTVQVAADHTANQ